jgi:magnesium transporter
MSSSPRDRVFTSSPTGDPSHQRRSSSPGDSPDPPLRPCISPPLSRSYGGNDPDARERQRTMDVDMAMQLSRARRGTFSASPFEASNQKQAQPSGQGFPITFSLSRDEQRALDIARGVHSDEVTYDTSLHAPRPPSPSPFLLRHLDSGHDPSFMISTAETHAERDQQPTPPTYQTNASRSKFDFAHMEEFAAVEKMTKASLGDPFEYSSSEIIEPFSDVINKSSRPARHRKISQSISIPRTHRKGIGGKMALFENRGEIRPPSLPGHVSLGLGSSLSTIQSSESLPIKSSNQISTSPTQALGGPLSSSQGILRTGQDRPYRFSFYSNALSATIHAQSLSELPAEGQTFEELFAGITAESAKNGKPGNKATSGDRIFPPTPVPATGGQVLKGAFENSATGRETPRTSYDSVPDWKTVSEAPHADFESNTWWLDVESPTDEEMRVLSKVTTSRDLRCFD